MRKITVINKEFIQFLQNRDSAFVDYLTQLPNRRGMYDYYNNLKKDTYVSVFFIDIDNFKQVNDVYGHSVGDELLKTLAGYLRMKFPKSGIFRMGGDEFVAITEGKKSETEAIAIATDVLNGLQSVDFRTDVRSQLTLSVGIIADQSASANLDEILKKCDSAMYKAKQKGKNSCVIFNSLEDEMKKTTEIEEEMEAAYSHNEFVPYLLPKINMLTKQVYGAELLVRWVHWLDGVRKPESFIHVFEKNGTVSRLDFYMFEAACKMMEAWKGTPLENMVLSVNFSPVSFYINNFRERLISIADKYGIKHEKLEIELPGKTYSNLSEKSTKLIRGLKEDGFKVSLDNFGGMYSPLTAIKELPVDTVKFERKFIKSTTTDPRGKKILRNLFTLCKDLKVDLVSVGVESEEESATVLMCGCYNAQGYYFSEPITEEEFIKYALSNSETAIKPVHFSFNGTLISEDGKYVAETIPAAFNGKMEYSTGPRDDLGSVHFPGSRRIQDNILKLPNEVLQTESWTICFWMRPETVHAWTAVLYIKCEMGFIAFVPKNSEEVSCYRIRDSRDASEWYDTKGAKLSLKKWYHVALSYNSVAEETALYINGKTEAIKKNVPTQRYVYNFWLGGDPYKPSFKGKLSELMIYPEVKTPLEIKKIYESYGEVD